MTVELESKYEVGGKVYIFTNEDSLCDVVKIKFDKDKMRFVYLLENKLGERNWYGEGVVHKVLDKE